MTGSITAINLNQRIALTEEGAALPITNMYDDESNETHNPSEAKAVIAGQGSEWHCIRASDYEPASSN